MALNHHTSYNDTISQIAFSQNISRKVESDEDVRMNYSMPLATVNHALVLLIQATSAVRVTKDPDRANPKKQTRN
jgi:hypothetical protein